jgi:hypothetical protein
MLKLRIISFFLGLLIIMQMVPVAAIGKALWQSQWTEELPHEMDENGKADAAKFTHPFIPPADYTISLISSSAEDNTYIHLSDRIPSNHSTDVVSPPPDILS